MLLAKIVKRPCRILVAMAIKRKTIFLSVTTRQLIKFGRTVHLMILYQDCSSHYESSKKKKKKKKKKNADGRGLFSPYIYLETFKNLLVRNQWTDFNIIWQGFFMVTVYQDCSSRHDSSKIVATNGTALIFPIYLNRKLKKIFLSETTGPISKLFGRNVPLVTLYQDCPSRHDL